MTAFQKAEGPFQWKGRVHPSNQQNGAVDSYPKRVRMAALEFRLAETLGGTPKQGWSPRKGWRLSPFLGAARIAESYDLPPITHLVRNSGVHSRGRSHLFQSTALCDSVD